MNEPQRHEMILEITHPTGVDEWYCPTCGRRMLINWDPEFKRTLLEAGDRFAVHSVVKESLPDETGQSRVEDVTGADAPSHPYEEDHRLRPWQTWLDQIDFDSLWKDQS